MHKRTMLSMVAVVTLMLVASFAVPMLTADGQDEMTSDQNAMPGNDRFGIASWSGADQQMDQGALMELFQMLPDREPLFAPLNNADGNISGQYISFMVEPSNGTIQDYALNVSGENVPVFDSVVASGFQPTTWNVSGPLFTSTSDNLSMFALNNPMGTFHVAASEPASINLSMPAGFTASPVDSSNEAVQAWTVTGNGVTAGLVVKNGTVNTNLGPTAGNASYVNVSMAQDSSVIFRALPLVGGFPEANERFLLSQMANGSVEGEMAMISTANSTFWYTTEVGKLVPEVNASKGSVIVNLTPMSAVPGGQAAGGENESSDDGGIQLPELPFTYQVDPNMSASSGQMMWYVIAMDKGTINPDNGTVKVMVNGHELTMANSSSELAGSNSMFWMYQGTNASKLVVPLPSGNGSVSIVVQEGEQAAPSTAAALGLGTVTTAGVAIIGVAAVVGVVAYAKRKR